MPNRDKSKNARRPQAERRQDSQPNPARQQEQQGDRNRQQGEMDREKDRFSNDY